MNQIIPLIAGIVALGVGSILGYYARQSIAKQKYGSIEQRLQEKISRTKKECETIISQSERSATAILDKAKREGYQYRKRLFKTEQVLLKRENALDQKLSSCEKREEEFYQKAEKLKLLKKNLDDLQQESLENLEKISKLSKEEARKELLQNCEKEFEQEILEKIRKLEKQGQEKIQQQAKKILALAIQKCAFSQAQEITTSIVSLPNDEIKGRIIGKEGRNIRVLEKLTGVEVVIDEMPEIVTISGFDPMRRQIAKIALEKLIHDGRIQPARIEEIVRISEEQIAVQIKEAGEAAIYNTGLVGLDPKILQLLGRLQFRISFGQNVLLHSIEVSHLAGGLAAELGVNINIAKKAGLLHDIGKAVDHQIEGSHVDIGIKILEKFGVEKEVITAMKAHHEEYPAETPEALMVQAADQISGARPGARKDTLENYLKRLKELEDVALSFSGVDKAYAIQAGREIRVFVNPEAIDDLAACKLARKIAGRIQEELRYPGTIKVNLIRESRIIEYAK